MKNIHVYGIGNPLIDAIIQCEDDEIAEYGIEKGTMNLIEPERGEKILASLTHKEKIYLAGGSCPNTMIALADLGSTVALGGTVGEDELGTIYEQRLQSHNVVSCLSTHPGSTGTSIILVSPDAERTMNTHLGVCRYFSKDDVRMDVIIRSKYLHFTGYMWDTDSQKEAIRVAIQKAKQSDTTVVFDLADPLAVERNRDEFLELLESNVDIAFANRSEAELLFEEDDPERNTYRLSELVSIAVVKNGAEGSFVHERNGVFERISASAVEPIDTIGAGDIYAAGFLHSICTGGSLRDAGELASFVAGKIVAQTGAQFNDATRSEIEAALRGKNSSIGSPSR